MDKEPPDNTAWLRLALEQIPAIMWTTDLELRFTSCTGAGLVAMGLGPSSLNGVSLFEHFKTEDPELFSIAAHRRALCGESSSYKHAWRGRVLQFHVQPLQGDNGRTVGCVGVAWDIAQLHHGEAQLRDAASRYHTLLKRIPAITYIAQVDEVSRTVYVTPQIECLGFARDRWTADRELWLKQLHPDDHDRVLRDLHHCHHTGDTFRLDYRMLDQDGDVRWFRDGPGWRVSQMAAGSSMGSC